ncbi:phage antirepressor N-terminal domain-containing protein [Morganella morganii]|nr:phage antirepressor N-terminal domain-containing protein [Morganella morganii]EKW3937873.1 phage antirepressor N-terminal domain-containing protein [Morganella morganii]
MSGSISTINVPFHGDNLYVVNYNGQPYVPMKPIVEGMGLTWQSQFEKVKQRFKSTITEIVIVAADGKERNMLCLALRKLAGWLHTISPNKVKPEIRGKVIRYQEECDDVLYEYWTTGEVKKKPNFRQSTAKELIPLRQTAERLIAHGVGNIYPDIWKHVHAEFGVQHINELLPEQIPLAISYLDALEGEYIPKQETLPVPKLDINYPLTWYPDNHPFMKNCYCRDGRMQLNRKVLVETQSPVKCILTKLAQQGYDVSSAVFEIDTLRHIVSETHWALHEIEKIAAVRDNANLTINI